MKYFLIRIKFYSSVLNLKTWSYHSLFRIKAKWSHEIRQFSWPLVLSAPNCCCYGSWLDLAFIHFIFQLAFSFFIERVHNSNQGREENRLDNIGSFIRWLLEYCSMWTMEEGKMHQVQIYWYRINGQLWLCPLSFIVHCKTLGTFLLELVDSHIK